MAQAFQSASQNQSSRAPRRRILQQEAPVLAAIAVLLSAWLVLALGAG